MTEHLDLDAIRARYERADAGNGDALRPLALTDVPALLAEVERLTADRDRLRAAYRDLAERTEREHRRLEAERDNARCAYRDLAAASERTFLPVAAERDQYRAVIERARRLVDVWKSYVEILPWAAACALEDCLDDEPFRAPRVESEPVSCEPCRRGDHESCGWDEKQPPHRCQCTCPTSASVDAGRADGAVAAKRRLVDLATVTAYVWTDPAGTQHQLDPREVDVVIRDGQPRVWPAIPEPGPEVTAVRDCDGDVWLREDDHWRIRHGNRTGAWSDVAAYAPLTDASEATPADPAVVALPCRC